MDLQIFICGKMKVCIPSKISHPLLQVGHKRPGEAMSYFLNPPTKLLNKNLLMKKRTYLFIVLFTNLFLVNSLSAQMSKELVKEIPTTPIENTEGEPELLPFKDRLKSLIDKESIFLNAEISSKKIARLLRTSPSVVEAIMESDFGQDYDSFINSRRVKSAFELLNHPDFKDLDYEDKEVMESAFADIAMQCGFKNSNHFAKQFKKFHDMYPEDYVAKELTEDE